MTHPRLRKLRRRRPIIWDHRGLPVKHVSASHAGRHFDLILYWAKRNGLCVITEAEKPTFVVLSLDRNPGLLERIDAITAVAMARRRNPGGIFTLADELFGARVESDRWMATKIWNSAGRRPVDMLATGDGVEKVRNLLDKVRHGFVA